LLEIIGHVLREKKTKLDLSNKDITELPPEICNLVNLKELNLSYNSLVSLPPELCKLKKLESLLLLRNELKDLPDEIGMLTGLRTLDVSYNPIKEFPPSIGTLTNLQNLDASYCELTKLPLEFINLLSLKNLYLENNRFTFPPEKIINRGLYATMHYLAGVKTKKESSRVIMQVFNMPSEIQTIFKQYIDCFNEMISAKQYSEISIDINFLNKKVEDDEDLNIEVETYLFDFVQFIKENLSSFKADTQRKDAISILDFQVVELRSQISKLNMSLTEKLNEIKDVQGQLTNITNILDKKRK